MTERKAGMIANKIYKAVEAKQLSYREALTMLDKLSPFMSASQFCKHLDFTTMCRHNPWLLEE